MTPIPPDSELQLLLDERRLSVSTARFYSAEVLIALAYMHERRYIYRDLVRPLCQTGISA